MLLSILKGLVVASSAFAIVVLIAALVEMRITRSVQKAPDYLLALGILSPLCKLALGLSIIMLINYVLRFHSGLPGGSLPGPESNSEVSMFSLVCAYAFCALPGVMTISLLRKAEDPDANELARRRRIVAVRREAERNRLKREAERPAERPAERYPEREEK